MHRRHSLAIAIALTAVATTAPAAPRHFRLDEGGAHDKAMRFMCSLEGVSLSEGSPRTEVTITRTGKFYDPRYGHFEITRDMLLSMVRNFDAQVYGQDISLDVAHKPEDGAAAKILSLKVDGNRLRAQVEFTKYGVAAVKDRGFRYLSAEFVEDFVDNEQGQSHGPTLLGAGLTTRPVIKRLDPVTLSESDPTHPVFLHPELIRQLSESLEQTVMNWKEELRKKLVALKLSEATITSILSAYEQAAKNLGEDAKAHEALVAQLEATGKTLAEANAGNQPIQLSVGAAGLSADDVRKLLAEERTAQAEADKKAAATKAARVKQFIDAIAAAEGLSDETRKTLGEAEKLITADTAEAQVTALAEQQIAMGNQLEAARKLSQMGFAGRTGSTHITVDDTNAIRKLSADIRTGLLQSGAAQRGSLRLAEEDKLDPFVKRVLSEFDGIHAHRLHAEAKMLAGGPVDIGDTDIPASVTRQVIIEAYQDLKILQLVQASVDATTGATHSIPYEARDTSAVRNGGIVYEGQAIHRAGVKQMMDYAYIEPRKLAMELTNEVAFFTRNSNQINWDAMGRNVASNAQVMRELVCAALANRMQRSADAYLAADIADEAGSASTVATNAYKTAKWPIIRPYQARDLQGTAVGTAQQPITVKDGATVLAEFDGSGEQAAGKYYRILSYNLGLYQIVDEAGAPTAPAGAVTISYSYTSNVLKVSSTVAAGSTYEKQMNKVLQGIGSRKAVLSQERFVSPDFALMSGTLHNMVTDAEQFTRAGSRADSGITSLGDLEPVKGVPVWSTNAPGIDLGDERILIGQRGNCWYTVAKSFQTGQPFEVFDSQGRPTGKKGAYGEEYSSMHVPKPLQGRFTSVIISDDDARG
ncbi:MAG TPA: hypothetical protein VFL78_10705 [Rhodanobacteraceae bacterium]|nr:hypothetical protein [Rhodanobacteraceae bacterium]